MHVSLFGIMLIAVNLWIFWWGCLKVDDS